MVTSTRVATHCGCWYRSIPQGPRAIDRANNRDHDQPHRQSTLLHNNNHIITIIAPVLVHPFIRANILLELIHTSNHIAWGYIVSCSEYAFFQSCSVLRFLALVWTACVGLPCKLLGSCYAVSSRHLTVVLNSISTAALYAVPRMPRACLTYHLSHIESHISYLTSHISINILILNLAEVCSEYSVHT